MRKREGSGKRVSCDTTRLFTHALRTSFRSWVLIFNSCFRDYYLRDRKRRSLIRAIASEHSISPVQIGTACAYSIVGVASKRYAQLMMWNLLDFWPEPIPLRIFYSRRQLRCCPTVMPFALLLHSPNEMSFHTSLNRSDCLQDGRLSLWTFHSLFRVGLHTSAVIILGDVDASARCYAGLWTALRQSAVILHLHACAAWSFLHIVYFY